MSDFFTTGLVVDVAIAILIILMVIRYIRQGFMSGIIDFFGTLISVGAAMWAANVISPTLFEKLFRENLITRTTNSLANSAGVLSINELLNKLSSFLPQNIIDTFIGENAGATFDLAAPNISQIIVEQVIQPLLIPVISILVFFVVFIVCRVIVKFIVAALKNVNKLPLLGKANKALGGVAGLLVGLLYGYIIVCAVWALVVITGGDVPIFSEAEFTNSIFYNLFIKILPFS